MLDNAPVHKESIKHTRLVDVLPLIINAWNSISKETITNCFNHGFVNWRGSTEETVSLNEVTKPASLNNNMNSSEIFDYDDFPICADSDIDNTTFLEQIESINKIEEDEEKQQQDEQEIGYADAVCCLKKLERYFLMHNNSALKNLDDLRNQLLDSKKQNFKNNGFFEKNK